MKKMQGKVVLISVWMYLGGPLVWGAWMVWRLKLLSPAGFLILLWPSGLLILLAFLGIHLLNLGHHRVSVGLHCTLIAALASIGTLGFLFLPWLSGVPGPWQSDNAWLGKASTGSLAGGSLVGMFYPVFSAIIFSRLPDFKARGVVLRQFHTWAYAVGILAYAAVAFLTGMSATFNLKTGLGMVFPLLMSGALLWKARNILSLASGSNHVEI
jgi:hypothetical protein